MAALRVQHEVTTSTLHSAYATSPRSMLNPVVRELKNVDSVLSASFIEIAGRKLSWKQLKQQLRGWRRELERCRRPGCGYFSDLGYCSRNKTPSKAVPRKELSMRWTMDDRLVRNTSSVILSKTWNLNKPLRREAVVFTIQTAGHSLKRNATVGGR